MGGRRIAVIGSAMSALPVAVAFAKAGFDTLGFDIDPARVAEIAAGGTAPARCRRPTCRP